MNITLSGQLRRWSVDEYSRLAEAGFFRDGRVELIDGAILRMSPQNPPHSSAIAFMTNLLVRAYGDTHLVRVQLPLSIGERSEPEPDFSLVRPEEVRAAKRHPTTADLVIEVSDSTLAFDRQPKASLYASAQVVEYWVLNIPEIKLEVYTEPRPDPTAEFGWSYSVCRVLLIDDSVTPQALQGTLTLHQLFDWPR